MPRQTGSLSKFSAVPAKKIQFAAKLRRPGGADKGADWLFLHLPKAASIKLPSRGMVSVSGMLNGEGFEATLSPDGSGGHWLKVDKKLQRAAGVDPDDSVTVEVVPALREPEAEVPPDLKKALTASSARVREAWKDITAAARRDFIHWIVSPKRLETRIKRIETACDMLAKGKRRPCCFDRSGMYDKSLSCPVADDAPEAKGR